MNTEQAGNQVDVQPELHFLDSAGFSADLDPLESVREAHDRISDPFDPEQIDIVTKQLTVDLLLSRLRRGVLDLAPDFQRKAGIWTDGRQSQLIESLLLKIPVPTFYAAETDIDESWEMVDGIQRLTAIARFIDSDLVREDPLILKDLQYLDRLNGHSYEDLSGGLKTRLHETQFTVNVIGYRTPAKVKFNIFARINTGGLPLTYQELRHALIPGPARELLKDMAQRPSFLSATQGSVSDARMSDREMVLRFLAFVMIDPSDYRATDLDEFLREAMEDLNDLSSDRVDGLRESFDHAMQASERIFEGHTFRKRARNQTWRRPINKALFETVAVNLAHRTHVQIEELVERRNDVNDAFIELLEDPEFERSISVGTGDRRKVRHRFSAINSLLKEFEGELDA
ncbi:uncharacterized protein DUF262 [Nocardiopsis sp. Huas11]|uniref:DUF262 domain-containing protein n=1 Tax=Nocardiopsis sp. Huas11 TaxID=2183912 RepID=UPI000F10DD56|nr:DUF262 domain-containing protein [Nocardiopsis sp. Huas11]RKS08864.1 uncharacterized protein DUF262 [Nocardiopsis sp. Huas11]